MPNLLTLPAELTIYTVSELRPAWMSWLAECRAPNDPGEVWVHAHAQAVDTVDAAGLQLVLALARSLGEQGRELRLIQASETLVEACALLGVSKFLGIDEDREVSA